MGSTVNPAKIANTFKSVTDIKISAHTISKYLEHLEDAFLISEAERYDIKGRKYIGADSKYYFEDPGIRNAILGFRQIEPNHTMENVIYNELRKLGYTVDVGLIETVRRDKDGKNFRSNLEIDFVVNRIDERVYIQSAYMMPDREKVEQEQASLLRVPDGFKKVIITGDRFHSHYNYDGILIKGIFDFLLQGL